MARWGLTVMICVTTVALVAVGGASVASGNEPPMAEAGLDQTVDNGTTVYLDAGGSVDPDGTLATVQWELTDPDGDAVTPDCPTCTRTEFRPNETGQYTANLTVIDDDGATRTDTLYVTVETPAGPNVTLTGPAQTTRDQRTEFTVSTTAGDADLRRLHWLENGSDERQFDLSGDESNVTLNRSFSETKSYELEATVLDTKGYSRTSSLEVRVVAGGGGGAGSGTASDRCEDGGSPYFAGDEFIGCNDGGADMIYGDHVLEANGESGLDLYDQDTREVTQMVSESQVEELQKGPQSALTRDVVEENYEENWVNRHNLGFDSHNPRQQTSTGSSDNDRTKNDSPSSDSSEGDGSTSEPPSAPPVPSLKGGLIE